MWTAANAGRAGANRFPRIASSFMTIPRNTRSQEHGLRDPFGMLGTRPRDGDVPVTIGSAAAMNLRKRLNALGYKSGSSCSSRSRPRSPCSQTTKMSTGCCLVEMGACTTAVALFPEGKIRHLGTIGLGA